MSTLAFHGGLLRRLYVIDKTVFIEHLLRLDPDTRHERFGMAVSNAWIKTYAEGCFGDQDIVYGFFDAGKIRAAGELRQLVKNRFAVARAAEAAFSVEAGWRRKGLGTELMARIVRAAQNRRDATLHLLCLAHNTAMQGLARKFAAELAFDTDQVTGRMIGKHLTPFSLLSEAVEDAADIALAVLEARRRRASNVAA